VAHGQEPVGKTRYFLDNERLSWVWFFDNGVEIADDRHAQGLQHAYDIRSFFPSESFQGK